MTEYLAQDRFTVTFSGQALQAAKAAGINLPNLAGRALGHINALLPGPKTTITVSYAPAGKDHSVRILAGPGFGQSLLQQIISEGISSVFDETAFPGPPNPWDRAISPRQECALWRTATPRLGNPGLYDLWMFGGDGVPHWTGFTIGYDIVADYRDRHPQVSWPALTALSAAAILAGSHYQPCRS